MKTLHPLSVTRLTVLEFGQHIKSVLENINALGANFITDAAVINYVQSLSGKMSNYDAAVLKVAKSDETLKLAEADKLRDNAITSLTRLVSVYELSPNDNEVDAYKSLQTLLNTYKGLQRWNFEEETNGIDNLLADFANPKYTPHITLLNVTPWITQLTAANTNFRTLFTVRTQETSAKQSFDVGAMRKEIKIVYDDAANYILSMAKAQNTDQYNKTLDVINAIRKYYYDLLAKRKPSEDGTPPTPIPPMS